MLPTCDVSIIESSHMCFVYSIALEQLGLSYFLQSYKKVFVLLLLYVMSSEVLLLSVMSF